MIAFAGHCRRAADGSISAAMAAFGMTADFALANLDGKLLLLDCARARRTAIGVRGSLCAALHWPSEAVA